MSLRLRPQRDRTLVRLRTRRTRRRRAIVAGIAVAVAALGGWAAATWRIQEVRVAGTRTLGADVVAEATGLTGAERLLLTRLSRVEERVERLPAVRSASVRWTFGRSVLVRVVERDALAKLDDHPELAADADGVLFSAPPGTSLPALTGWRGRARPGRTLDRTSGLVLKSFARFPAALRSSAATVTSGKDVSLMLREGTKIRFGAPRQLVAKAEAAALVLADAARKGVRLDYIDVRAPRTPVARERATPAPTAKPAARATPRPSGRATSKPGGRVTPKPSATTRPASPTPKPRTPSPRP